MLMISATTSIEHTLYAALELSKNSWLAFHIRSSFRELIILTGWGWYAAITLQRKRDEPRLTLYDGSQGANEINKCVGGRHGGRRFRRRRQ